MITNFTKMLCRVGGAHARWVFPIICVFCCLGVEGESRVWTLDDGRSIEGSLVSVMGASYVLKTEQGKQVKIPAARFSEADQLHVELSRPPSFEIDFIKNLSTVTFSEGFYGAYPRYPEQHGSFGMRVKQTSAGSYKHTLHAELIVVAQQIGVQDKKCYVLDHQEFDFTIPSTGKRIFEFMSERQVRLENWHFEYKDSRAVDHGENYYGYVIIITDVRNEIIALQSSKVWLEEAAGQISNLKVGNYFNKDGERCFPGRPKPLRW